MPSKPFSKSKPASFWSKLDPFTYVDEYVIPVLNPRNNEFLSWGVYIVFSFVFAFALYSLFGFILQTQSPLVIVVSGSMLPTMARGDVVILQGVDGPNLSAPEVVLDGEDLSAASLQDIATLAPAEAGGWAVTFHSTNQSILVPKKGTSDIVVYESKYKKIEIIHRAVVKVRSNGKYYVLTKGDNNPSLDQDCGAVVQTPYPGTDVPYVSTSKSCPSPYLVPLSDVRGKALGWIPFLGYIKLLLVDSWQNGNFM